MKEKMEKKTGIKKKGISASEQRPVQLAIRLVSKETWDSNLACALCGQGISYWADQQLCLLYTGDLVCLNCGNEHAPALSRLFQLAKDAARYGRSITEHRIDVATQMGLIS